MTSNRCANKLRVPDPFDYHIYIGSVPDDQNETNELASDLMKYHGLSCCSRYGPPPASDCHIVDPDLDSIRTSIAFSERCVICFSQNYDISDPLSQYEIEAALEKTSYSSGFVLFICDRAIDNSIFDNNSLLKKLRSNSCILTTSCGGLKSSIDDIVKFCAERPRLDPMPRFSEKISGMQDAVVYMCDYLIYLLENCHDAVRRAVHEMWTRYCEEDCDEEGGQGGEERQVPKQSGMSPENVYVILPIVIVIPSTCNAPTTMEVS